MVNLVREIYLYLIPIFLSTIVAAALAAYTWRRRDVYGSRTFALLMANVALWSLTTLGLLLSPSQAAAAVWYRLRYLSIATVPPQVLIFGLQFSGRDRRLNTWGKALLFVVPFLTLVFLWAVPGWFTRSVTFSQSGILTLIDQDIPGPWFRVHFLYSFISVLIGLLAVIIYGRQSALIYRWQAVALVLGGLPLFIISAVLATFIDPTYALLTPLGFLVMGLVYTWALFRYKLLDLATISRSLLVDRMGEGVVVLDSAHRISDINPTAAILLGRKPEEVIGRGLPREYPQLYEALSRSLSANQEVELALPQRGDRQRWFAVKASRISTDQHQDRGSLLILADISQQKAAQAALTQLNQDLESIVAQRTSALESHARRLESVSHISTALRQAETQAETLRILAREVVQGLKADGAAVFLLQDDQFHLQGSEGLTVPGRQEQPVLQLPSLVQVLAGDAPQTIFPSKLVKIVHPDYRCLLQRSASVTVVPLLSGGKWIGALWVVFRRIATLDPSDLQILQAVAEIAVIAMNRILLHTNMVQMAQDRRFKLAVLYEITAIANQHQQLPQLLGLILKSTLQIPHTLGGVIALLQEDGTFATPAVQGEQADLLQAASLQDNLVAFYRTVVRAGEPTYADLQPPLPPRTVLLGLPIMVRGAAFGTLGIAWQGGRLIPEEDAELLGAIADQIGIAVENDQLRQQAEQAAVMLERQRLARELHDSVTQSLYGSVLLGKGGLRYFETQQYPEAENVLQRIVDVSQQALKEMRLLIHDLQPLDLEELGFREAVRQRLENVEKRLDIQTVYHCPTSLEISGKAALNLYRIVQEGLNNVLKHSGATRVKVEVSANERAVRLRIEDNGSGFDLAEVQDKGGFGLNGMHERVRELEGTLTIRSSPGKGTTLTVECPNPQADRPQITGDGS